MRKITNYTTISMEFPSTDGVVDVAPFSDRIRQILTDRADYGWELAGAISTNVTTYSIEVEVAGKKVLQPRFIKTLTVGLVQYREESGY